MKNFKLKLLAIVAVICVICASVGSSLAYFSSYASAEGSQEIKLGGSTTITEPLVENGRKHIVISNSEEAGAVYVRAIAYAGSDVALGYDSEDGSWAVGGDGYSYYLPILYGGESTSELLVTFQREVKEDVIDDAYNVIVLYEATPVQYEEDGTPYADWNLSVNSDKGGLE